MGDRQELKAVPPDRIASPVAVLPARPEQPALVIINPCANDAALEAAAVSLVALALSISAVLLGFIALDTAHKLSDR